MTTKEPRRVIGDAKCGVCGKPIKIRITEKNKLYANCIEAQGGCGAQVFSRSATADKHLARTIEKWMDTNERRAYLGEEALPAKARTPAPDVPPPPSEPESEPEAMEPEADEPPPPPPPAAKPKADKPWWEL